MIQVSYDKKNARRDLLRVLACSKRIEFKAMLNRCNCSFSDIVA